jgi:hypothetical protein
MRIFISTLLFLLLSPSIFATTSPAKDIPPTIVDTLYLEREECVIAAVYIAPYGNPSNTYYIFGNPTLTGGLSFIGDGYYFDEACNTANRLYFSFPISEGHTGYNLSSAQLMAYQWNSSGNSDEHVFPIWGQGESHGLLAAHVNFSHPLTSDTFTPTFCQNMGTLSSNEVVGWRNLDVTGYYLNAKEHQNWDSFQVMLYFDILTDWDNSYDDIAIGNPNYTPTRPRLLLTYQTQSASEDETQVNQTPKVNIYPNPARTHTNIKAENGYRITNVCLYNLKGQKVRCDNILTYKSPNELQLNTETLPAGVYMLKCDSTNGNITYHQTQRMVITN